MINHKIRIQCYKKEWPGDLKEALSNQKYKSGNIKKKKLYRGAERWSQINV